MWTHGEILDPAERSEICSSIIDALPNWFGIPDSNASYIKGVAEEDCFVVRGTNGSNGSGIIGMVSLRMPFPNNADIYWLGVLPDYHHQGVGRVLLDVCFERARDKGCETITVETLGPSDPDEGYRRTRAFYTAMGFKPLIEHDHFGPENPLLYMVRAL